MPEIESTPLSAAGTQGLAECTDCILSTAVFVCLCVPDFHHACVQRFADRNSKVNAKKNKTKQQQKTPKKMKYASCFPILPPSSLVRSPLSARSLAPPSLILLGEHGSMQWKKLSQ